MTISETMVDMQYVLFLPQMRLSLDDIVRRAKAAEAGGFEGIAFMDHLAPPMAEHTPMFDAMMVAGWVAAHTSTLRISHLVLCDAMRHPAILAKEAVTLDHASGGRFELGIGWGSLPAELVAYGVTTNGPRQLAERMAESLQIMEALWTGETVDFQGQYLTLSQARQLPTPLGQIPIVIGGTGPLTMEMVARHATWWNVPVHQLKRLDKMRDRAGNAKLSVQRMVAFVRDGADRHAVEALARRRFGHMGSGLIVGDAAELRTHFAEEAESGVERSYVWFADFAEPDTLAEFGATVIAG